MIKLFREYWPLLIGLGVLSGVAVGIYVGNFWGNAMSVKTQDWGVFGDYIGGVLGTALAILTVLFVYATYRSQRAELLLQKHGYERQIADEHYQRITRAIEDASYEIELVGGAKLFQGLSAFYEFSILAYPESRARFLNSLTLVLSLTEMALAHIERNRSGNAELNEALTRTYLLFYEKVLWSLHPKLLGRKTGANTFDRVMNLLKEKDPFHDDAVEVILPKYARISMDCVEHLLEKKLIAASPWKDGELVKLKQLRDVNQARSNQDD